MGKRRSFLVVLSGDTFWVFSYRCSGFVYRPGAGQRSFKDFEKFTFRSLSRRVFGNIYCTDRRGSSLPRCAVLGISTFGGRTGGVLPCYAAFRSRPRASILSELLDDLPADFIERFANGIAGEVEKSTSLHHSSHPFQWIPIGHSHYRAISCDA